MFGELSCLLVTVACDPFWNSAKNAFVSDLCIDLRAALFLVFVFTLVVGWVVISKIGMYKQKC